MKLNNINKALILMKSLISILLFLCLMNTSTGQKTDQDKSFFLIVGTYTSNGKNDGIYVYDFNSQTGENSLKSKVAGEENPSFLAISHDGRFLYSANEVKNGNVSSFKFDKGTGELSFLNRVSSGGDSPCFVEVDVTNKFLFTGNYGSGTLSAIPINSDGTLRTDIQSIKHEGSSIDESRQQSPHVHSTFLTPDNKYILVPDLGTDKVNIYSFDLNKSTQPLTPSSIDHRVCVVSQDWLAADRVGIELMGIDFSKIGYLNHCASMALGNADLNNIEIIGENLKDHIKPYKLPNNFDKLITWMNPKS